MERSWISQVDLESLLNQVPSPVFVYSEERIAENLDRVISGAGAAGLGERVAFYIPFFPNANPHLFEHCRRPGVGILVQIPGEHRLLREFGFEDFIVSPGHVSNEEIAFWAKTGYPTFLSSIGEVAYALEVGAPTISARIDSLDSGKPGIKRDDLGELAAMLDRHGRTLDCLEVYCGSGNSLDDMVAIFEQILEIHQRYFPQARTVNFAGGHGFVYESWDPEAKHFDWGEYFRRLAEVESRIGVPHDVRYMFEPARDVLADSGVLVLDVERAPIVNAVNNILVTNGTRMLMPSAQLRDRRHNVAFLDTELRPVGGDPGSDIRAAIRGRTILRNDYLLPGEYPVPEGVGAGHRMLVMDVGAYCATQHMEFLNVPPAAEVLVKRDGTLHQISAAGDELDKWRNLLRFKRPLAMAHER